MSKSLEAGLDGFKDSFKLLIMIWTAIATTVMSFAKDGRHQLDKNTISDV